MKKVTLLFMSLLCALAVAAQIRGNEIRVIIGRMKNVHLQSG